MRSADGSVIGRSSAWAGSTLCRSRSSRWFEVSVTRSRWRSRSSRSLSGSCSPAPLALRCLRSAAMTNASTSAAGTRPTESGRLGLSLQHGLGDVIAVAHAALVGMAWAHAVAADRQTGARSGGRVSLAAGSAAPPPGPQAWPARPRTAADPGSARGRHDEPRPGRPPRRCRTGS